MNNSEEDDELKQALIPERFGDSTYLIDSIVVAEFGGRLIHELRGKGSHGRPSGSLVVQCEPIDRAAIEEVIKDVTCFYEDKTEWATGSVEILFSRNNALFTISNISTFNLQISRVKCMYDDEQEIKGKKMRMINLVSRSGCSEKKPKWKIGSFDMGFFFFFQFGSSVAIVEGFQKWSRSRKEKEEEQNGG
ncbi:hypothetical protein LXL04_030737 [Taraxacum kok-saghyz]